MSQFIIFASARSGSTSLAEVLNKSKGIKMAFEPFHPKFNTWTPDEKNYSKKIHNSATMNDALNELFSKYTSIKVLDYQFPKKIYFSMLNRKEFKIVFLRRKNLLSAAISNVIAHQTSQWQKQPDQTIYDHLKPIKLNKISEWVDYVGELNETYHQYLETHRKGNYLELIYEQLYSERLEKNKQTINEICQFLNISMPPINAIKKHMTPSQAKINSQNIYHKIPNFKEIKAKFGKIT